MVEVGDTVRVRREGVSPGDRFRVTKIVSNSVSDRAVVTVRRIDRVYGLSEWRSFYASEVEKAAVRNIRKRPPRKTKRKGAKR